VTSTLLIECGLVNQSAVYVPARREKKTANAIVGASPAKDVRGLRVQRSARANEGRLQ
jgi:hypothetical protein